MYFCDQYYVLDVVKCCFVCDCHFKTLLLLFQSTVAGTEDNDIDRHHADPRIKIANVLTES